MQNVLTFYFAHYTLLSSQFRISYSKTLYFRCVFISQFLNNKILLHFNFGIFSVFY